MFKSATRVSLLLLIVSLIALNVYSLINYPDTVFKDVFAVLNTTVVAVTSFFFGKSSSDGVKPPVENVEKDKASEKSSIDISSI